ncbi:large ribosomal subunit protein bL28 [Candidatus Vidania fulgoroideorum]
MSRLCFINKKRTIKGKIVSNSKKRNIRFFFPNIKKIKIKNFNFYFKISTKSFKKFFKNV